MKEISAAIYPFPWSDQDQRVILNEGKDADTIDFFGTPVILAPRDAELFMSGRSVPLPKLGPPIKNEEKQLFEIPHGFLTRTSSPSVKLVFRMNGRSRLFSITCKGAIQPLPQGQKERGKSQAEKPSFLLSSLISSWVAIINEIFELLNRNQKGENDKWRKIAKLLLEEKEKSEPHMALIVKIAEKLGYEITDIAQRPRRILLRTRNLYSMERIQELDSTCLQWLAHQPGKTIPQKAGVKQELLAVIRNETHDTLENRVVKDFLKRCNQISWEYLNDQKKFEKSSRYNVVARYKEICSKLLKESPIADVQAINRTIRPNYALQCDNRYRKIWEWYQKLLHQDRLKDKAWDWQSRLWADIVRLLVAIALTDSFENKDPDLKINLIANSSPELRNEQISGSWLIPNSMPGPCWFEYGGMDFILEFIDSFNAKEHKLRSYLGPLGGHLYVLITDVSSQKQVLIVFWAVHCAGSENSPSLFDITKSASDSLFYKWKSLQQAYSEVPPIAGCILISTLKDMEKHESCFPKNQPIKVQALQLPSKPERWFDALIDLQYFLAEAIDLIKGGRV